MPILLVLRPATLTMRHTDSLSFPMLIPSFCCWSEIRNGYASFFKRKIEATITDSQQFFSVIIHSTVLSKLNNRKGESGAEPISAAIPVNQMTNVYPEICILTRIPQNFKARGPQTTWSLAQTGLKYIKFSLYMSFILTEIRHYSLKCLSYPSHSLLLGVKSIIIFFKR